MRCEVAEASTYWRANVLLAALMERTILMAARRPLRAQCEASLKRLRTEVIDLYYLHRVDPAVPVEDSVGALGRLVEQGKLREIGLSEVAADTLKRAHREFPIAAVQSNIPLDTNPGVCGVENLRGAWDCLRSVFTPWSAVSHR